MAGARVHCQLYLAFEVGAATREQLAAVLARGPVASVLLKPAPGGKLNAATVKPLIELGQQHNAAMLLLDDVALARTLRADGVHLTASADVMARYDEARGTLDARAIVGADAGGSRHVAMEVAEAGADYVAFGSDMSHAGAPAADAMEVETVEGAPELEVFDQRALIDWWSRVFEVPCVAFDVAQADDVLQMAALGADFIAVTAPRASSPSAVADWFEGIRSAVERADA